MADKKHYIITSITLGAIAAVSAGLIGLTNLITEPTIKENESKKISSGIKEIFGQNAKIFDEESWQSYHTSYLETAYLIVNEENNVELGYAFRTTGKNSYGKISLIVGFDASDLSFKKLSIVANEQSYASTLVDNYINPLNGDKRDINDVSCGATYGAKLVRDMINQAGENVATAKTVFEQKR